MEGQNDGQMPEVKTDVHHPHSPWVILAVFVLGVIVGVGVSFLMDFDRAEDGLPNPYPEHEEVEIEVSEPLKKTHETFSLRDGEYSIINSVDLPGESEAKVLHLCDWEGNIDKGLFDTVNEYCFGENVLVYSSPAKTVELSRGFAYTVNEVPRLFDVAVKFKEHPVAAKEKLVVVYEPSDCDFRSTDLCVEMSDKFSVYDVNLGLLEGEFTAGNQFSAKKAWFSPDMTKYVTPTFCWEGCPDHVAAAHNVVTDQVTKLLPDVTIYEDGKKYLHDESAWKDNDTYIAVIQNEDGGKERRELSL